MIGWVATAAKRPSILPLTIVCLSLVASLSGCGEVRRAIGMDRSGPDEFAVESRAPLTLPPDFDLRPPTPGAARPQEATAADRARKVIDTAGPGEPGKQASSTLKPGLEGGREQADPTTQVGPNSLAGKLLGSGDSSGNAATRQTTPMKGVY
jgi:hypothetical protein